MNIQQDSKAESENMKNMTLPTEAERRSVLHLTYV